MPCFAGQIVCSRQECQICGGCCRAGKQVCGCRSLPHRRYHKNNWQVAVSVQEGLKQVESISSALRKPKNRKIAALLAWSGVVLPISGLHKFYLGQPVWGVLYLLLHVTHIPQIASVIEGIWYLCQSQDEFDANFNGTIALEAAAVPARAVDPEQVGAIAEALRHLDQLRQDGLISEYEFEQKRRQFLDRIA